MSSSAPRRFQFRPRARIARAVSAWARSRQGEDRVPLTLQARRIYILPTRSGLAAAALLLVMLVAVLTSPYCWIADEVVLLPSVASALASSPRRLGVVSRMKNMSVVRRVIKWKPNPAE